MIERVFAERTQRDGGGRRGTNCPLKQRAIRTAIVAVTIVVLAAAIYGVAAVTAPAISAVRCQGLRAADARFHEVNRQRIASFIPASSKVLSDEEKACGIH